MLQVTKIDAKGTERFIIRKNMFYVFHIWLLLVQNNNSSNAISVRKCNNCYLRSIFEA